MKRIAITLAVAGAFALPATALAEQPQPSTPTPTESCKTQRDQIGAAAFKDLYGTNKNKRNAFGKCVSKQAAAHEGAEQAASDNAPARCRAEQTADPAAFAEKYGTNKNKKNAFGKCVSATAAQDAAEQVAEQDRATVNAARACKRERAADPAAFAQKYGANANKKNAFGTCVAQQRPTAETATPA